MFPFPATYIARGMLPGTFPSWENIPGLNKQCFRISPLEPSNLEAYDASTETSQTESEADETSATASQTDYTEPTNTEPDSS